MCISSINPHYCISLSNHFSRRFYADAGQALAAWSGRKISSEDIFTVKVEETFHIYPKADVWIDFVCIWKRVESIETDIVVSSELKNKNGCLKTALEKDGYVCNTG